MLAFIVHPNPADQQVENLANLLTKDGHKAVPLQSLNAVRDHTLYGSAKCLIVVADPSSDTALAARAVDFAEAESRHMFLVYVADTMSADAYKRLVRTAAGEWITWRTLPAEIAEVLRRAAGNQTEHLGDGATVISFLPSKGGVGNTTLALEAGIYLASANKRNAGRVAVIDLNFQNSTLADYVDLEPRFDITEIMDRPERLDAHLIEIFSSKHSSQVDVFSSPPRIVSPHTIQPEVIFALLDEVAKRYSYVLLDLPNQWHGWLDNVLIGSSAIVVTGEATVPSIKQIINKQKHLDSLTIRRDKAAIIVNACDTNLLGRISRKGEIDRTFSGRQIFYVRRDTALAVEAANTGRPLMLAAPNRPISKNIRRVGDWIQSVKSASSLPS